jgi:hypothetical protein
VLKLSGATQRQVPQSMADGIDKEIAFDVCAKAFADCRHQFIRKRRSIPVAAGASSVP